MSDRPLSDVRVLDLTHVWAGPLATRILGDLGAEVLKLEAPFARGPADVRRAGGGWADGLFVDKDPGHDPWNRQAVTRKLNRNKKGLCIDLKSWQGKRLFLDLVAHADVVIENFSARVMTSLGLGYDTLKQLNPGIIYVGMPGFGASGRNSDFVAFGPSVEPLAGVSALMGYSDTEPRATTMALPDAIAGVTAAAAVVTALHKRDREGKGSYVDLALQEATVNFLGEHLIERQITGREPSRSGNRHARFAPQGIYPCRAQSGPPRQENWIAISCRTERQWQALCTFAARQWCREPRFRTQAGRRKHHDELDEEIAEFTRTCAKEDLMMGLQEAGVPAGAVMTAPDMLADPQALHRHFFHRFDGESTPYPGSPVLIDGRRGRGWKPAPGLGEHNAAVLSGLLGLSPEEIDRLSEQGVLANRPSI